MASTERPGSGHDPVSEEQWRELVESIGPLDASPFDASPCGDTRDPETRDEGARARPSPVAETGFTGRSCAHQGHQGQRVGSGPRDYSLAPEPEGVTEEEYYNPQPGRLNIRPLALLSWGALAASIVIAALLIVTHRASSLLISACLVLFFASIVSLVRLLPRHRDIDDDGAQL